MAVAEEPKSNADAEHRENLHWHRADAVGVCDSRAKCLCASRAPREPNDKKLLPRFPIALEGDIPFLLASYSLGGSAEPPEDHVAYFRKHGQLRAKPLSPTETPFAALDSFAKSPRWIFTGSPPWFDAESGRRLLGDQVLRLLDSVHRFEPNQFSELLPADDPQRRTTIIAEASSLRIRWDHKRHRYTFLDERVLPQPR